MGEEGKESTDGQTLRSRQSPCNKHTHWISSQEAETGSTSLPCQQPGFSLPSSFPPTGKQGWNGEQRDERRKWSKGEEGMRRE